MSTMFVRGNALFVCLKVDIVLFEIFYVRDVFLVLEKLVREGLVRTTTRAF